MHFLKQKMRNILKFSLREVGNWNVWISVFNWSKISTALSQNCNTKGKKKYFKKILCFKNVESEIDLMIQLLSLVKNYHIEAKLLDALFLSVSKSYPWLFNFTHFQIHFSRKFQDHWKNTVKKILEWCMFF